MKSRLSDDQEKKTEFHPWFPNLISVARGLGFFYVYSCMERQLCYHSLFLHGSTALEGSVLPLTCPHPNQHCTRLMDKEEKVKSTREHSHKLLLLAPAPLPVQLSISLLRETSIIPNLTPPKKQTQSPKAALGLQWRISAAI